MGLQYCATLAPSRQLLLLVFHYLVFLQHQENLMRINLSKRNTILKLTSLCTDIENQPPIQLNSRTYISRILQLPIQLKYPFILSGFLFLVLSFFLAFCFLFFLSFCFYSFYSVPGLSSGFHPAKTSSQQKPPLKLALRREPYSSLPWEEYPTQAGLERRMGPPKSF